MYKLIDANNICKFAIVGISRDASSPKDLVQRAKPFITKATEKTLTLLEQNLHYFQMDFHDRLAYNKLKIMINNLEQQNNLPGNRLFYLATMPDHFIDITAHLALNKIAQPTTPKAYPWYRVVYEKPFGTNLATSKRMNKNVMNVFNEHQIYRIDHYLGKELVSNIALTRFTNTILEPLWNNKYVASVHINLSETIGVEQRGAYYDSYGSLKDMIQSHGLQLLALTAMEQPKKLTAQHIRDAKSAVLKKITVEQLVKGQYNGYLNELGIAKNSSTDTYAALKLNITNKRWKGVPFYVTNGKYLDVKETTITLVFKQGECLLTACPSVPNFLLIKIDTNEGIYLGLNAKIPGNTEAVAPITMDFCHDCLFGPNSPKAYETLLSDVVKGDQSAFVRSDEVELSWKIIEQAEKLPSLLESYEKNSAGPKKAQSFYAKAAGIPDVILRK